MSTSRLRCCCYLLQALLLILLALCSQLSPRPTLLRNDYVNRRRRRRHDNSRFGNTVGASKSFVALSRGGADAAAIIYAREEKVEYDSSCIDSSSLSVVEETLIKKEEYNDVDDHKRRQLDDALVRAVDEILHRTLTDGNTTPKIMPKIDIVYVNSNNIGDEVVNNPEISSEYVRNFVDVATNRIWDARYRKTMEIAHDGSSSSSSSSSLLSDPNSSRYEIVVDITQSLAHVRIRPTAKIMSMEFRRKLNTMLATAISRADKSLMEMESEMDDCFLIQDEDDEEEEGMDEEASNDKRIPMPQFGDRVNAIVDDISSTFASFVEQHIDVLTETDKILINDERIRVLKQVLLGFSGEEMCIQRLYNLHLQGLRDYFGRQYEVALTSSSIDDPVTSLDGIGDARPLWKSRQRNAARVAWEGFHSAASASIPQICQPPNGELCDIEECAEVFSFVEALRGLLEDMQDATTTLGIDELDDIVHLGMDGQGDAVDNSQLQPTTKRMGLRQLLKRIKGKFAKRGPSRWYERLAAKAFVIGVNYVQGWIVLQTLRREARRRDLAMPKFPLF